MTEVHGFSPIDYTQRSFFLNYFIALFDETPLWGSFQETHWRHIYYNALDDAKNVNHQRIENSTLHFWLNQVVFIPIPFKVYVV